VYVIGFERRLTDQTKREVIEKVQLVADHFGKNAVFVHSSLRDRLDKLMDWYRYGHGPALASVILEMEHVYKKIYVAASNTMYAIQKCSTHPYIDPLWSTETLEFAHDAPISRLDKLRGLADNQFALDLLRVCFQGGAYNCSQCEKCVRTMMSLSVLGLNSAAFGKRPPLSHINKLSHQANGTTAWALWNQNIVEMEELLKALKGQL